MVYARSTSLIKPTLDMYAAAGGVKLLTSKLNRLLTSYSVLLKDFRYGDYGGVMESGTAAMELITAVFDGPLCFLVAFGATHNLSYRHPLQIILCTCQLYGLTWFILQPMFSDTGIAGHFSSDPVIY